MNCLKTPPARCELMNGDILMIVNISLVQVKDQYNLSKFYVKLRENISIDVNHAEENVPIDPSLCKSSL